MANVKATCDSYKEENKERCFWPDGRSQKLQKNKKRLDLDSGDWVTRLNPLLLL